MATVTSLGPGLWSAGATWDSGTKPAHGDTVNVNHAVTMDVNENDATIVYGRINVNAGASLTHAAGTTCFCCSMWLYVSGGTYEMKPGSTVKFKGTSKTSTTEGGVVGIFATGNVNNTRLILNGSVPLPETDLTTAVALGDHILSVTDASGFSEGEYIAVYRDISGDATWNFNGTNQSDEGFIIHHISGNDIYIQQRVAAEDTLQLDMSIGNNYAYVNNIKKWQPGLKLYIDNEVFAISAVDETQNKLTFTGNAGSAHTAGAKIVETGAQKVHSIADHVYKIATVLTTGSIATATTITVANASMLNIGDRIVIEGYTRTYGKEFETTISNKVGNVLTVGALPYAVSTGYIVTKTNRDCVVTTTDTVDTNRCMIYYSSGSTTYTGRKCVLRYVEVSHIGNNGSNYYQGVVIRSDFNRTDTEREVRGCVIRDGWNTDRNGLWIYTASYIHSRNNVIVRTHSGIQPYDVSGSSTYNNISIGSYANGIRIESNYYQNQHQYNIVLNTDYAHVGGSNYTALYPWWHNIFKHTARALYFSNSDISHQYCIWIKNKYEDYYYKHHFVEGGRAICQDIICIPAADAVSSANTSGYCDYDSRGNYGGGISLLNEDLTRGQFEIHMGGGWFEKDSAVHMGNGWSYKGNPNSASVDLRICQGIYCKYGITVRVVAWMKKNAAYNGSLRPRIVVKGTYFQAGVLQYIEMPAVSDQWVKVIYEFVPTRSEMFQIGVSGRGTAGNFWIDPRVKVTTFDSDLVNGPYSVNLMFGLEEIYSSPIVLLGGTTIG